MTIMSQLSSLPDFRCRLSDLMCPGLVVRPVQVEVHNVVVEQTLVHQ